MRRLFLSLFRRWALKAFNRAFEADLRPESIQTVRQVATSGLKLAEQDLEAVQLVVREGLRLRHAHLASIKLLLSEGLDIQPVNLPALRIVLGAAPYLGEAELAALALVLRNRPRSDAHHPPLPELPPDTRAHADAGFIETLGQLLSEGLPLKPAHLPMLRALNRLDPGLDEAQADALLKIAGHPGIVDALQNVTTLHRLDDVANLGEGFQICFSQEGESLILDRFFNYRNEGFFVDVGAHHPKRFSNTYSMYRRGWRGISIDPTPGLSGVFESLRKDDLFLPVAVSDGEQAMEFFQFNEPALNTFSRPLADEYLAAGYKLLSTQAIMTRRLDSILAEHAAGRSIDFMSIDVEDHELPVLKSNDWTRFRPRVLLVEVLNFDMEHAERFPVHVHIADLGYSLFAKTCNTLFYKDVS